MFSQATLALPLFLLSSSAYGIAGQKPYLGYNSYNDVGCTPNSTWMETTIQAMSNKGLSGLGYVYFQVDCGWQGHDRLSNGSITYDETRFPNGMTPISQLARSKGMKFGMYTDQGVYSCDTGLPLRPGSLGHEDDDAARFQFWGAEYMKVDNCYVDPNQNAPKDPRTDFPSRFGNMSDALAAVGINDMLICQWGTPYLNKTGQYNILEGPAEWTPPISSAFRVSDDIAQGWANVERIFNENIHVILKGESGPSNWADMDLLEVGNPGMTFAEQRSHFAVWAMFKSTLMVSTNVPALSDQAMSILSNKALLAINQDDLGKPVKLIQRFTNDHDVYGGPLAGGDYAVLLLESGNAARTLTVNFARLGIKSADVTQLWTGKTQQGLKKFSGQVAAHGSLPLRLTNVVYSKAASSSLTYYPFTSGNLTGNANIQDCRGCSNGKKVGNLLADSSVTIGGIYAGAATMDVRFDYINCDVGYLGDQKPNYRTAAISVNGGPSQLVDFPLSGYEWTLDVLPNFLVRLSGFNTTCENTITVSGPPAGTVASNNPYAPDFDRIGVVQSMKRSIR